MIDDFKTWGEYKNAIHELNYGRDLDLIADNVREFVFREKPLSPADLSHDLLKWMFINACKKSSPEFVEDGNNERVINLITMYVRGDEKFTKANPSFKLNKGILLRGNVGTGKTVLMKGLRDLLYQLTFSWYWNHTLHNNPSKHFSYITSNNISSAFSIDGEKVFLQHCDDKKTSYIELINNSLCIDDIGSEPTAYHYGQSLNSISEVLIMRYEKNSLTHATSNLSADQLKEVYGLRVFDRMREMFNDILLPGESRRH